MKTRDQNLENAVARWHADAELPAALRARVLENATVTETFQRHAPRVNRRRVWCATGAAMALSAASIAMFATVSAPARPAFAEVEAEMSKIKTVQWSDRFSTYEVKTGNENTFMVKYAARLFPPALRSDLGGGTGGIITPQWDLQVWPNDNPPRRDRKPSTLR